MRRLHVNAHMHVRSRANTQRIIRQCSGRSDVLTPPFLRMNSHSQLTGTDVMFLLSQLSSALRGVSRRFNLFTHTQMFHSHIECSSAPKGRVKGKNICK